MIWSEIISHIITLIAGGAAGSVLTYYLNKKGNKEARQLKKEELRIRNEQLSLEKEKQRLEDLPKIVFGNSMQSSPLSGQLKIELLNQGADCNILEVDTTRIKGKLIHPGLPCHFYENSQLYFEFRLPRGSEILRHTFPHFIIPLKIQDKHYRIYSCSFEVNNVGGSAGINITPLKQLQ